MWTVGISLFWLLFAILIYRVVAIPLSFAAAYWIHVTVAIFAAAILAPGFAMTHGLGMFPAPAGVLFIGTALFNPASIFTVEAFFYLVSWAVITAIFLALSLSVRREQVARDQVMPNPSIQFGRKLPPN
jgi:hypothetical protein